MKFFDRLLTIVITATLTSAVWIVFGGPILNSAGAIRDEVSTEAEQPGAEASSATELEQALEANDNPGDAAPTSQAEPKATSSPSATAVEDGGLLLPVRGVDPASLTDTFLDARGDDGGRLHEAIDIMAPKGTDVLAAAPGTIARLHRSPAGGNTIYLRSADKETIHFYAHLDQYASGLREGQRVARGQRLGMVGSTGNAEEDAPHLHFAILKTTADAEWWEPANAVNPYPLLTGAD